MTIAYTTKNNQRAIGDEVLIVAESHTIGIIGIITIEPNVIKLLEVPFQESPSSVAISGFSEVTTVPGTNEFLVDYASGRITFNAAKNGQNVVVAYRGRGSLVDAVDVNELQDPVGVALDIDGEITAGHVKPVSISTNPSDDFVFPNKVTITGDLDVQGTLTTIQSETVTIDDNKLLLNSNVTGAPTEDSGLEIERGSSPNVEVIWNETNDSWQFKDTSGAAILEAFDTGKVTITSDLTVGGAGVFSTDYRSAIGMTFDIDDDNNSGAEIFTWRTDLSTTLMTLNEAGDLDVTGGVTATSFTGPSITTLITSDTGITYGIDEDNNSTAELHIWRTNNSLELMRLNEAGNLKVTGQIGINIDPVADFHNQGSTILGLTSATDPASIVVATVDDFTGITISSTIPVSVTIPTPTNTTAGRFFTLLHNDTSSGTLNVNGSNIGVGKGATFMWDATAWIPVGATGGFEILAGDPGAPVIGDVWFNTVTNQFKGYNGTINVILG